MSEQTFTEPVPYVGNTCPHYCDNQGVCHNCGWMMDPCLALWSGYYTEDDVEYMLAWQAEQDSIRDGKRVIELAMKMESWQ